MLILAVITSTNLFSLTANAETYEAIYYKGSDHTYNTREQPTHAVFVKETGALWWKKTYEDHYVKRAHHDRCVTYYHDGWIRNQGQIISVSQTVQKTAEITSTVKTEIGADLTVIEAKLTTGASTSMSTTYAYELKLEYDLAKYSEQSLRIAAMGRINEYNLRHYIKDNNGDLGLDPDANSPEIAYAFDTNFGYEICLVYRY